MGYDGGARDARVELGHCDLNNHMTPPLREFAGDD